MDDPGALNLVLLAFRLIIGLGLAFHGYAKITRGGKLEGTGEWFHSMGMRPGSLHAKLAAYTEVGAGVLMAIGFLTPFAAAAFVALMFVAFWTVHKGSGFLVTGNGWEYNLVLAASAVVVATIGAGEYSLDNAFGIVEFVGDGYSGTTGLLLSLIVGLGAAAGQLTVFFKPDAVEETRG